MRSDKRQPKQIIREASAHSIAGRGMPPVLHVSLDELSSRSAQNLRALLVRCAVDQGHHVLKLVAKAVGAAGLVESRPPPDAAAQHLVDQPAVEQEIE